MNKRYYVTDNHLMTKFPEMKMFRSSCVFDPPREIAGVGIAYGWMEFNGELSEKVVNELKLVNIKEAIA